MKQLLLGGLAAVFVVAAAGVASAQPPSSAAHVQTSGSLSPTPEMWFYAQELQRHDDPRQAVRRKAEAKSEARQERMMAMKWFGFSNSRPQASPTPFTGIYSPVWQSNSANPYAWLGRNWPYVAIQVPVDTRQR